MADGGPPNQGVGRGRGRGRHPAVSTLGHSYGKSNFSGFPAPSPPLIVGAKAKSGHIQVCDGVSALAKGVQMVSLTNKDSADGMNEYYATVTESETSLQEEHKRSVTSILTSEYETMMRRLETLDAVTESNQMLRAENSSLMIQLEKTTDRATSLEAEVEQLRSALRESSTHRIDEELRRKVETLLHHNLMEDDGVSQYISANGSEEESEVLQKERDDNNSNQLLRNENEILRRQIKSLQRQQDSDRREANLKFNRLRQEKDQLQNDFSLVDSHLVRETNLRKALEDELDRHFLMQKQNGLLKEEIQQQKAIAKRFSSKTRYSPRGNQHHQMASNSVTGPAQHLFYPLPINSSQAAFRSSSESSNGSTDMVGHTSDPSLQQMAPPNPSIKKKRSGGAGAKERYRFNKILTAISEGRGKSGPWGRGEQLVYPRWPQTDDQDGENP